MSYFWIFCFELLVRVKGSSGTTAPYAPSATTKARIGAWEVVRGLENPIRYLTLTGKKGRAVFYCLVLDQGRVPAAETNKVRLLPTSGYSVPRALLFNRTTNYCNHQPAPTDN